MRYNSVVDLLEVSGVVTISQFYSLSLTQSRIVSANENDLMIWGSKIFKVPPWGHFSTDYTPKLTDLPSIFHLTSIWSCKGGLKVGGCEINLLNKSCSNKKSSRICYTNFKSFSNKSKRIFWFEQLLYNKVDFGAFHPKGKWSTKDFSCNLNLEPHSGL